jgi:HK97 family phage portal protein
MAGFLSRLFGRSAPVETRDAAGAMLGHPVIADFGSSIGGRYLSAHASENLSGVLAAINAISSGVASLQPLAFRREGSGRAELPYHHWLPRLLREPSERYSYAEWAEALVADCALHGNALCEIVTDQGGRVVALEPISWRQVSVVVLPTGRVAYDVTPAGASLATTPRTRRLFADEVLHLRDRTDAGEIVARSRLARASGAVANMHALQEMSAAVWEQGLKPSGYFKVPQVLSQEQRSRAEGLLAKFRGARSAGKHMLIEGGWTFEQLGIDAESKETLESRRFSTEEIARVFQISPILLQDFSRGTYTNAETAGRWFGQFTVGPWARRVESALRRSVLGAHSDLVVELDMSSLLRGSDLERWQTWKLATEIGAVGADEIRLEEGWGPRSTGMKPQVVPDAA